MAFHIRRCLICDEIMMETYATRGSGTRYISARKIQEMKKNMKKVPLIKQKSDSYHHAEEIKAEHILDEATTADEAEKIQVPQPKSIVSQHNTRFQKIGQQIHRIRHFIFHT